MLIKIVSMSYKEEIIKLRNEGKTYNEIKRRVTIISDSSLLINLLIQKII